MVKKSKKLKKCRLCRCNMIELCRFNSSSGWYDSVECNNKHCAFYQVPFSENSYKFINLNNYLPKKGADSD